MSELFSKKKLLSLVSQTEADPPNWASLPREVLALIRSNLRLINDCNGLRAVCKAWEFAAYPDDHIGFGSQLLLQKMQGLPFVTFHHPLARDPYCMDCPELRHGRILCSRDGWLLICRGYALYFFNPFSKSVIKWPFNLPCIYDQLKGVTFTSPATSEDCLIIALATLSNEDGVVGVVTSSRRQEFWTVMVVDDNNPSMFASYCCPIYLNGRLWCLRRKGDVRVIHLKVSQYDTHFIHPLQIGQPYSRYETYLLDFNGEVIYVFVCKMGHEILILRWDDILREWQVVDDLGEHMLFLSKTTSFARKSMRDCMKNKIYFPRFHGKYVVFYSLEDRSYHTFGDNFSSRDFNDTMHSSNLECCWIEPNNG